MLGMMSKVAVAGIGLLLAVPTAPSESSRGEFGQPSLMEVPFEYAGEMVGPCGVCICCDGTCGKTQSFLSGNPPPFGYELTNCGSGCPTVCSGGLPTPDFATILAAVISGDAASIRHVLRKYDKHAVLNAERHAIQVTSCDQRLAANLPVSAEILAALTR